MGQARFGCARAYARASLAVYADVLDSADGRMRRSGLTNRLAGNDARAAPQTGAAFVATAAGCPAQEDEVVKAP